MPSEHDPCIHRRSPQAEELLACSSAQVHPHGASILSATTCGNRPPGSSLCQEYLLVLSNKKVNTWVSCWQLRKEKVLAQWSYWGLYNWHSAGSALASRGQAAVPCAVSVWAAHTRSLHLQRAWITHWDPIALIRPGRSFLHWVISLLSIAKRPHHHIRLNHGSIWPDVVKGVLQILEWSQLVCWPKCNTQSAA